MGGGVKGEKSPSVVVVVAVAICPQYLSDPVGD